MDPVKLSGAHVWPSEVFETRAGACGPNNLGGSATLHIAQCNDGRRFCMFPIC
jgi:hypothetical protein